MENEHHSKQSFYSNHFTAYVFNIWGPCREVAYVFLPFLFVLLPLESMVALALTGQSWRRVYARNI